MSYSVGADIGGTTIKFGLVDHLGQLLFRSFRATEAEAGQQAVLKNLQRCIQEALDHLPGTANAVSIGIGSSGLVDVRKGVVKGGAPNLPDWNNLPLGDIIRKEFRIPVFVDNDANLMGFGEFKMSGIQEKKSLLFLTIGTGIGGAVIIDGQLVRGAAFAGSELGCIPMNYKGKKGYWEDFCSTSALVKRYIEVTNEDSDQVDGKIIVSRYLEGEPAASNVLNEHFDLLGQGLGGLINIFNPSEIIIGGGISEAGIFYIEGIEEKAREYALEECLEGVSFSAAKLGNSAGVIGAGLFALEMSATGQINMV